MHCPDELRHFEPFAHLSREGKELFVQGMLAKGCARSSIILRKGEPVSGAYLVLEGRLRVYSVTPKGTEATLYFIDPGETCVLALNCLFNDLRYPAWVQAEADVRVGVIPGPVYRKLFEQETAIRDMTVQTLSTLVFRLMAELEQVHSTHHRQRLANFILLHAGGDGVLRATQQQLAQHLGTTREVVARLLGDFVARGFVQTSRGAVAIVDVSGLRAATEENGGEPPPRRKGENP